jgi:hypothetical protein
MHAGRSEATLALHHEHGRGPVSFGCAPADGATTGAVLPARHTVLRQSRFHGPRGQIDVAPTRMRRA